MGPELADLFQAVRQLGVGVPSGLEIAYHTVQAAIENYMDSLEEGHDDERLPIALQYDFENSFNRACVESTDDRVL